MQIIWPSNTVEVIDEIREVIGRNVIVDIPYTVACSACSLDPITNTSTDSFCNVCDGVYWIPTLSGMTILAHITWGPSDQLGWITGGQLLEGECRIQIKNTPDNLYAVLSGVNYYVDDKIMYKKNTVQRGVKELNRIIINLKERGNDD